MPISSFSSLAATAFDTARSTIKAMADAAAAPPTGDDAARNGTSVRKTAEKALAARTAEEPQTEVRPRSRRGNSLDAYA